MILQAKIDNTHVVHQVEIVLMGIGTLQYTDTIVVYMWHSIPQSEVNHLVD